MSRLDWLTKTPIAHRGLHDAAAGVVENSPSAITRAVDAGYSVEIDVRLTADGNAVVYHDATLERLTASRDRVIDLSTAALCDIAYAGTGDKIATLAQTLDLVSGRRPLVIELKTGWANVRALAAGVARDLENYRGTAAVMSFDPRCIAAFRKLAPQVPRGIVACRFSDPENWPELSSWQRFSMRHFLHVASTRPHFVSYDADDLPAPAPRLLRALGLPVITWTVRSERQGAHALKWSDQITFEGFQPQV